CVYIPLEQRAAWLIEKGVAAWQQIQQFAIAHDELLDSVVLLGHDLWLPHHETDGRLYSVTLRVAVHFPPENRQAAAEQVLTYFQSLERGGSDERGSLLVSTETR
ncbi:MAG TPA: hypothetical protein VFU47_10610, partial [Armatimonadota bacterium]|nr:hypothetical protein [Armatimonadota bacterium]